MTLSRGSAARPAPTREPPRSVLEAPRTLLLSGSALTDLGHLGGTAFGLLAVALVASGALSAGQLFTAPSLLTALVLLAILSVRLIERFKRIAPGASLLRDLEIGVLALAATELVRRAAGPGLGAEALTPLLLVLYAAAAPLPATAAVIAVAIGADTLSAALAPAEAGASVWLRLALLIAFGLAGRFTLGLELRRRRWQHQRERQLQRERAAEDARLFRLTSARDRGDEPGDDAEERERLLQSSVGAVRDGVHSLFELSWSSFASPLHSLLLLLEAGGQLHVHEAHSESEALAAGPFPPGAGVLGAASKSREPLNLHDLPRGYHGVPWYTRPSGVGSLAIVGVHDRAGHQLGLLIADRLTPAAFSEQELAHLQLLAREVVRVLEFERLFMDLFRDKRAYEKFHRAARDFNQATRLEQVAEVAIAAAQDVSQAEFAALTIREEESGRDLIVAARWRAEVLADLAGRPLWPDAGLVAKAIKLGHALPEPPTLSQRQALFDPSVGVKDVRAARVHPLHWSDRVVGTLVVGGSDEHFLTPQVRRMLEVIAEHAATSVVNAQLYERQQTMATTDGLTGLYNHRFFQERLQDAFHRAIRYKRALSLLITDLDHFKSVNDTYGHPVGDMVLQRVSECLQANARRTDFVARYGGEEFAIIMEETDWAGALRIAERIRQSVASQIFQSPIGTFRCTLSVGIACYPEHVRDRVELVASADKALYEAKQGGRDRAVVYGIRRNVRRGGAPAEELPARKPAG